VAEKGTRILKKTLEDKQMTTHKFTKSIIVQGDLSSIFNIWANFENFPHFMQHIKSVTKTDDKTSHWIMSGPLGKKVEWDAKTTTLEPNKRIAWNSTNQGDNDITTSGQVSFNALPDNQVEVTVTLQYIPPAGKAGDIVANLLSDPEDKLETDLRNFKAYAEQQTSLVSN
jgi:uncharacterized membrane protein